MEGPTFNFPSLVTLQYPNLLLALGSSLLYRLGSQPLQVVVSFRLPRVSSIFAAHSPDAIRHRQTKPRLSLTPTRLRIKAKRP